MTCHHITYHFTTAVTSHHITQPRSFWAASDLTTSRTSHIHRSHITSQITHITHISQKSSHLTTSHITSRKKRTRRRSSWAEFLGRMAHHTTSHQITHHKPKEENTKKKFLGRVLGPDDSPHHISPDHTSQAERREHKEEVLGPSSWAGWLTTPHLTISHITSRKKRKQRRSSWAEFLGRMAFSPHHTSHIITSHHITHHKPKEENTKKKFLGRVLGPDGSPHHISPDHTSQAERREHEEEVLGPSSWAGWHSHHITHHHISPPSQSSHLTTSDITSRKCEKVRVLL